MWYFEFVFGNIQMNLAIKVEKSNQY